MILLRPCHRLFRTALLVLLALCLVTQPVLAALGEMHERRVHPESATLHLDQVGSHADGAAHDESEDTLHLLLHFAHCCGQTTAVFAANIWTPAPLPTRSERLAPSSAPRITTRLNPPFRPPIAA
ncbi:MAG: hypothetical protein KDI69_11570 [Xanthomonadales bacterium]|nr:hypothetical protein [Xanthomonadales bacterium]